MVRDGLNMKKYDEKSDVGVWSVEFDEFGNFSRFGWSGSIRSMLGYRREEELSGNFDILNEILHPNDRYSVIKGYIDAIRSDSVDGSSVMEYRLKNKNGEYRWYRSDVEIERKGDGTPVKMTGKLSDINDEKRSLIKSQKQKEFYKAITNTNICEYYVDLSDDSFYCFKMDDAISNQIPEGITWGEMVKFYVDNIVCDDSKSKIKKIYEKRYVRTHLNKDNPQINVDCKNILNGQERWVRNTIIINDTDEYGETVSFIGFLRDITSLKEHELKHQSELREAKHKAELQLNTITDAIPGGFKICENKTQFVYISPQLPRMFGYSMEEFQNISNGDIYGCMYEGDRERVKNTFDNMSSENESYTVKYRVVCKDGSVKWISDYGKNVIQRDGSEKYYSFVLDINEQELLTELLEQERKQYRDALVQNAIYFYEFDVTEGILTEEYVEKNGFNPFMAMGIEIPVKYDEFISKRMAYLKETKLGNGNNAILSCQSIIDEYKRGNTFIEWEMYGEMMDEYRKSAALMYEDSYGHIHAFITCTDVTEFRKKEIQSKADLEKAHEAAEAAYRVAERASQAKTIFLNNMSHDIRTPMNAIVGFTSLALSHADDEERVRDYLKKITISSNHLLSLINDVLDMSRIESGKVRIEENECNIVSLMNDLENLLKADVRSKSLNFTLSFFNIKNENIICDKLRLNQILINCVGNSIKFTKPYGDVGIKVVQKESTGKKYANFDFIISDTGIGMSKEFAEHIFEPFSREENTTISGIPGTGLGMSITKSIVNMMNGDIKVNSELCKGTEFVISLSFEIADSVKKQEENCSSEDVSVEGETGISEFASMKVLVVEDVQLNREIIEAILTEAGLNIVCVENGKKAVEFMENAKPGDIDLILMDVMMPVMNGYDATRHIRKLPDENIADITIIAMTANAFEEDKKQALEAGMNAHVSKPINIGRLYEAIKMTINR